MIKKHYRVNFINSLKVMVIPTIACVFLIFTTAGGQVGSSQISSVQTISNQDKVDSAMGSVGAQIDLNKTQLLLPEGFKINDRLAKLIKLPDETAWFLAFEEAQESSIDINETSESLSVSANSTVQQAEKVSDQQLNPLALPMEVLPGQWLNTMLKEVGNQVDMTVDFRVWGEVTTYHNSNYILPIFVGQPPLFGKDAEVKDSVDKSKLPENLRQALAAIYKRRRKGLTESPNIEKSALTGGGQDRSGEVIDSAEAVWKDGYMIIDRVGRFRYASDNGRWFFHFEADGASLSEPPVIMHPSQLLEEVENLSGQRIESLKFRVTGQISKYQNSNYMLARMVWMVYDQGNIGK